MTMKVVHLSTADSSGGAGRAALRLHLGLREAGVDSQMLVQVKSSDYSHVHGPVSRLQKMVGRLRPHVDQIPFELRKKPRELFSLDWVPGNILRRLEKLKPDLVHVHWTHKGFVKPEYLARVKVPFVWTLHDQSPFTGGCHFSYDCRNFEQACGGCRMLGSRENAADFSSWVWKRKSRSWKNLNIEAIAPSTWIAGLARKSSLFKGATVRTIPHGLDLNWFKPVNREFARELLCLPKNKKIILHGAVGGLSDGRKGSEALLAAIRSFSERNASNAKECELVIFGSAEPPEWPGCGIPARFMGFIDNDAALTALYSAADVMVVPSIQESFGQTASESLACGTPVVAFGATGLLDIVAHQETGFLARAYETEDLANGLEWVLSDHARWLNLCKNSRSRAEKLFGVKAMVASHLETYRNILENNSLLTDGVPPKHGPSFAAGLL